MMTKHNSGLFGIPTPEELDAKGRPIFRRDVVLHVLVEDMYSKGFLSEEEGMDIPLSSDMRADGQVLTLCRIALKQRGWDLVVRQWSWYLKAQTEVIGEIDPLYVGGGKIPTPYELNDQTTKELSNVIKFVKEGLEKQTHFVLYGKDASPPIELDVERGEVTSVTSRLQKILEKAGWNMQWSSDQRLVLKPAE